MWKLASEQSQGRDLRDGNPIFEFKLKNVNFSSVAVKPESKSIVYAVGTDKSLKEIENGSKKLIYEAG